MPGTPSSKGCESCRKQKKKCDAPTPPCGRCARLRIPCVGLGVQRYKFVNNKDTGIGSSSTSFRKDGNFHVRQEGIAVAIGNPSATPTNALSNLTSALISKVDPTISIRVSLPWSFGFYFQDIPRRLGTNEALDAATDVLVTIHNRFCARLPPQDTEIYEKHSKALNALRRCLNDTEKAHSSETLCAVMLLMTSQAFTGMSGGTFSISHATGAAQIMRSRGSTGPQNGFEKKLILSLRGSVIFEALFHSKIRFSPQEWQDLVASDLDDGTPQGAMMRCLARVPELMRRGREALASSTQDPPGQDLIIVRAEAASIHEELKTARKGLREHLHPDDMNMLREAAPAAGNLSSKTLTTILHANYARLYGLCLAVCIIVNCIFGALLQVDLSSKTIVDRLREESSQIASHILEVETVTAQYRPLGGLSMVVSFYAALIGTRNEQIKERVHALMLDYRKDIIGTTAMRVTRQHLEWLERRFWLEEDVSYAEYVDGTRRGS